MIKIVALIVSLLLLTTSPSGTTAQTAASTVISGGDLPHAVRLAAMDADALVRRINLPPKLDREPKTTGPGYVLTSGYWDEVLRAGRDDRAPADAEATYFPAGGFVRAQQGGNDVWVALDLRQQALLNRYIRLGREGRLPQTPQILQVLLEAARTETISIDVGHETLSVAESAAFWRTIEPYVTVPRIPAGPTPLDRIKSDEHGAWIIFTLPEGRAVQVFYAPNYDNVIVDSTGTDVLYVSPGTRLVLGSGTTPFGAPRGGPIQVAQQPGRGAPFWWFVMIGGGAGALILAFWLNSAAKTKIEA